MIKRFYGTASVGAANIEANMSGGLKGKQIAKKCIVQKQNVGEVPFELNFANILKATVIAIRSKGMKKIVALILSVLLAIVLTGCEFTQTTSAPAEPSTQINVDRDFVYDWLLENGELQNGEELVYTSKDGQSELTVQTDASKRIWVYYDFQDEEGNHVSMNMELFREGKDKFECEILDDTETGVYRSYQFKRATFTRKSPISNERNLSYYIDGGTAESVWMSQEGPKMAKRSWQTSKEEHIPVPEDKYNAFQAIRENFAERAQQHLCSTLDAIHNGFCVPMGITIHDLGYEKFEAKQYEGGAHSRPSGPEPGYTDL